MNFFRIPAYLRMKGRNLMEFICEKCRRLVETVQCPFCGSVDTHEPEDADLCYLTELDGPGAAALSGTLELRGIPFQMRTSRIGKVKMYRVFFVPYDRIEDAWSEVQKLTEDRRPAAAGCGETAGNEVFSGEEIDRMEAHQLDKLDLEELKAYKGKIMRTLKEIKAQQQAWKDRTVILLDMKEEAEYLIEDLT